LATGATPHRGCCKSCRKGIVEALHCRAVEGLCSPRETGLSSLKRCRLRRVLQSVRLAPVQAILLEDTVNSQCARARPGGRGRCNGSWTHLQRWRDKGATSSCALPMKLPRPPLSVVWSETKSGTTLATMLVWIWYPGNSGNCLEDGSHS